MTTKFSHIVALDQNGLNKINNILRLKPIEISSVVICLCRLGDKPLHKCNDDELLWCHKTSFGPQKDNHLKAWNRKKFIEADWRIYASVNEATIGSDNALSPVRRQDII